MRRIIQRLISAAVIVITAPLMVILFCVGIILTTLFREET